MLAQRGGWGLAASRARGECDHNGNVPEIAPGPKRREVTLNAGSLLVSPLSASISAAIRSRVCLARLATATPALHAIVFQVDSASQRWVAPRRRGWLVAQDDNSVGGASRLAAVPCSAWEQCGGGMMGWMPEACLLYPKARRGEAQIHTRTRFTRHGIT